MNSNLKYDELEYKRNLTVQDKPNKLVLVDPMNSINHDQARKNPPRVTDLKQCNIIY